jgi:hypothetical protein
MSYEDFHWWLTAADLYTAQTFEPPWRRAALV